MKVLSGGLIVFGIFAVAVGSEGDFPADLETDQVPDLPRYVVFPGLDADPEEIAEWNVGFATPFNVFFGPKPYILGWMGEGGFGPPGDDDDDDYYEGEDGEFEEGEEGEEAEGEEGEEAEGEEGEEEGPEYDYENR